MEKLFLFKMLNFNNFNELNNSNINNSNININKNIKINRNYDPEKLIIMLKNSVLEEDIIVL